MAAVRKMNACVGCGKAIPPRSTDYTLISDMGWRLQRSTEEDGTVLLAWRCPACWKEFKKKKDA
jgi:hypothetical protein